MHRRFLLTGLMLVAAAIAVLLLVRDGGEGKLATGSPNAEPAETATESAAQSADEARALEELRVSVEQTETPATPTGTTGGSAFLALRARFVDSRSKQPIPARLECGAVTVLAGAEGIIDACLPLVSAEGESRAETEVAVSARGYLDVALTLPPDCGPRVDLGTISMKPDGARIVRVLDSLGVPVEAVWISVRSPGRRGPAWYGWTVGTTDSDGELMIRALPGEVVGASRFGSSESDSHQVRSGDEVIELVLSERAGHWIGLRDHLTGTPVAGVALEVLLKTGYPQLRWSGQSTDEGLAPVVLQGKQAVLNVPGPTQLLDSTGAFRSQLAVDLVTDDSSDSSGSGIVWVKVAREEGRWLRFMEPSGARVIQTGIVETFRDAQLPDGSYQGIRVETRELSNGLLQLDPLLAGGPEPLYAVVSVPGCRSWDSRRFGETPPPGEVRSILLEAASAGAFRLVDGSGAPVQIPIWLYSSDVGSPVMTTVPDASGYVGDIPHASRALTVCSAMSPAAAFATIPPADLSSDPPIEVVAPSFARVVVEFAPGVSPSETLELATMEGGRIAPILREGVALFENLLAGRYALGTANQQASNVRRYALDPDAAFPILLHPGQNLRIQAESGWGRTEEDSPLLAGRIFLEGPETGVVVRLCDQQPGPVFLSPPSFAARIDSLGHYELPVAPDVSRLAVGTLDADTGDFVPLSVFEVGDRTAVAKGAHLVVVTDEAVQGMAFLELRLDPVDFAVVGSIVRGLESGGRADFGWVPLGKHDIRILGGLTSVIPIEEAGEVEYVLLPDGAIVPGD